MNLLKYAFTLLLLLSLQNIGAQTIDTAASKANFSVKNLGLNSVKGTFTNMKGNVSFDETDLSVCTFDVCIDAATINSKNKTRDNHLRKEAFFGVEQFPTICFVSESVSKTKNGYLAKGDLNMHGVTKSIKIPFIFDGTTFVGNFEIKRKDFNIGSSYGSFVVGNNVQVEVICSLK